MIHKVYHYLTGVSGERERDSCRYRVTDLDIEIVIQNQINNACCFKCLVNQSLRFSSDYKMQSV